MDGGMRIVKIDGRPRIVHDHEPKRFWGKTTYVYEDGMLTSYYGNPFWLQWWLDVKATWFDFRRMRRSR